MLVPFSPPDISEADIAEVVEALRSGWITTGPRTKQFESAIAAYVGTATVAALGSATAAMELTLRILGVGPGDEVITSAYTYTASASVIDHVGARIVLVDTAPGSYLLDPQSVDAAITPRTKAVIGVDIGGVPLDYEGLRAIAAARSGDFTPAGPLQEALGRVAVIADAAHSFGATRGGRSSGQLADVTCFSFHAVKNLTTAEGGAATWLPIEGFDDAELYRQYMLWSLHGQTKDALSKTTVGGWEYDVVIPGYKHNMTDLTAALGLRQLERYPAMLARRHELVQRYDGALLAGDRGVTSLVHRGPDHVSNGHLYMLDLGDDRAPRRDAIITRLAERGVASNVHFKPLPLLTAYRSMGLEPQDYPHAMRQFAAEITLPLNTVLTDDQADYVVEQFLAVVDQGA